jgi:hypothetical protein
VDPPVQGTGGGTRRESGAVLEAANITADRLIEPLERSGHVVMCKPGLAPHGAPSNLADAIDKAAKIDRDE